MPKPNRPFALLLAAVMFAGLWIPTLAMPSQAYPSAQLA